MLNTKDKIDLAIRAGLVAESVLGLMRVNHKDLAKLILNQTGKLFLELDKKIEALPED